MMTMQISETASIVNTTKAPDQPPLYTDNFIHFGHQTSVLFASCTNLFVFRTSLLLSIFCLPCTHFGAGTFHFSQNYSISHTYLQADTHNINHLSTHIVPIAHSTLHNLIILHRSAPFFPLFLNINISNNGAQQALHASPTWCRDDDAALPSLSYKRLLHTSKTPVEAKSHSATSPRYVPNATLFDEVCSSTVVHLFCTISLQLHLLKGGFTPMVQSFVLPFHNTNPKHNR